MRCCGAALPTSAPAREGPVSVEALPVLRIDVPSEEAPRLIKVSDHGSGEVAAAVVVCAAHGSRWGRNSGSPMGSLPGAGVPCPVTKCRDGRLLKPGLAKAGTRITVDAAPRTAESSVGSVPLSKDCTVSLFVRGHRYTHPRLRCPSKYSTGQPNMALTTRHGPTLCLGPQTARLMRSHLRAGLCHF